MLAGGFDPFHDGHLDHLLKASRLGDKVIVLVSNDQDMVRKKGKYCLELGLRIKIVGLIMDYYGIDGYARPTEDSDGTQARTISHVAELHKGSKIMFAKGGDRTKENMPQNEIDACARLGIEIVYGVGDKLNSSTGIVAKMEL
jgi:cytidyltransferase-like protein